MEEEKARGLHEMTVNSSPASLYISAGDASIRIRLPDEAKAASLAADLRELLARKEGGCVNETEMTAGCAADRMKLSHLMFGRRAATFLNKHAYTVTY